MKYLPLSENQTQNSQNWNSISPFCMHLSHIPSNTLVWNVNVFTFFTIFYFSSAPIQLDQLNDESPLSAASSSGTRTIPMPHFRHLLASLQVRSEYFWQLFTFSSQDFPFTLNVWCNPFILVLYQQLVYFILCFLFIHTNIGTLPGNRHAHRKTIKPFLGVSIIYSL